MSEPFIDKFSDLAGAYRQGRPVYPDALFERLATLAPSRDLAWDCGTGSGQAAVGLARRFAAVVATDPSAEQIARAIPGERVDYRVEPAERVSLADSSADLVLAAQSLHWFDLDLFYAEAARVLKPSGILAAIGYDWMYVDPAIDRAIEDDLLVPLRPYWAPQNAVLWAGYRSIDFPGEEVRIGPFAIYLDWSFEEVRAYVDSWSAVHALRGDGKGDVLDTAFESLAGLWGEGERRVVVPLHLRVAKLA